MTSVGNSSFRRRAKRMILNTCTLNSLITTYKAVTVNCLLNILRNQTRRSQFKDRRAVGRSRISFPLRNLQHAKKSCPQARQQAGTKPLFRLTHYFNLGRILWPTQIFYSMGTMGLVDSKMARAWIWLFTFVSDIIIIIIIIIIISCHRFSFFPGTSALEPVVNPTTQA
jgi:hypothetical protein